MRRSRSGVPIPTPAPLGARPAWVRYAVAVAAVVVAVLLRRALDTAWDAKFPLLTFFPAVMVAAWFGGLGPGLLATVTSAAAAAWFWLGPTRSLLVTAGGDRIALALFVGIGVLITFLNEALLRARRREQAARTTAEAATETLEALIRSSALGIVMLDPEARVRHWNPAAERIFGWTHEEVLGRPLPVVPPEHWAEFRANLEVSLRGGAFTGEVRRQRKGGLPVDLSVATSPMRDASGRITGVVTVVADITERKRTEEALRESTERFKDIIESAMDAVITIDQDERIVLFNAAAEKMFRCKSSEVSGAALERFLPAAARAVHHRHIRQFGETGVTSRTMGAQRTLSALRADGEEFPMEATISQTHVAGQKLYTVIIRDVSERVRAHEEQDRLLAREQAARVELEAANRAKDEFLAMLGHELRNPLGAITGAVSALNQMGTRDDPIARPLEIIARQAGQVARLADDLLDVSRLGTGKIMLQRQPLDLRDLAERCVLARQQGGGVLDHVLSLSGEAAPVEGDPARLEQVVANLLDNALKYTPSGGQIALSVGREGEQAVLRVRDTGIGIPAEMLSRIFDSFIQVERSVDRANGGLGLGLALVKRLVELHGGTVSAVSAGLGRGSEFVVRLPLSQAASAVAEPDISLTRQPRRRIVVIEDYADAADALRLLLETWGHEVEQAADGWAGVDLIRASWPDLALIDVGLPRLDGYAVARLVRSLPGGDRIHLVALTGYGRPEDRRRALEAGFTAYLVKPVRHEELLKALAEAGSADSSPRD